MLKFLYNRRGKIEINEGLNYSLPKGNDFIWIFLVEPIEEELSKVTFDFELDKEIFQRYPKATHSERYGTKPFQFVFVDYFLELEKIDHTKILFILEKNFMIISIPKKYGYYEELFVNISDELKLVPKEKRTITYLLYLWLMEDTEENYDVLTKSEEMITAIEQQVLFPTTKNNTVNVEEIVKTKRLLFQMTRRFWASAKIIFAIKKGLTPLTIDTESMKLLDDIYDTFHHQLDIAAAQKDMATDTIEIYATMVSNQLAKINNNMSHVMKTLTAFTVIIMVPTLIAGIYGMNFEHIPLAKESWGFIVTIGGMGVLAGSIFYLFYHKEWI